MHHEDDDTPTEKVEVETIDEGTVSWLGDTRVPMGNVRMDTWTLPDGSEGIGLACALALEDGPLVVGTGAEFTIDGTTWRVVGVKSGDGGTGSVSLVKMS